MDRLVFHDCGSHENGGPIRYIYCPLFNTHELENIIYETITDKRKRTPRHGR